MIHILFLLFCSFAIGETTSSPLIRSVSVSKEFFNPTLGQTIHISFVLTRPGLVTLKILDRDAHVFRTLVSAVATEPGQASFSWNGSSEEGSIAPNESYSLWISFRSGTQTEDYFPANKNIPDEKAELGYYDKKRAVISYKLPKASRVHVQGGVAIVDRATKKVDGPVMATIVNREPRSSGWIVEQWDGFAESDSRIYVPDLPNFKLAVAATALPENSIIAVGNRKQTFFEYATKRKGKPLLTFTVRDHHHHQGLTSLEDSSPSLTLHPKNARWSEKEQVWLLQDPQLTINGRLEGVTARSFSLQPGHLMLFVDGRGVQKMKLSCSEDFRFEIPGINLSSGTQIISANCASEYGPTAAFSLRIKKDDSISKNSAKEKP